MQRNTICITQKGESARGYTTDYIAWYSEERPTLFQNLRYFPIGEARQAYSIPKVNDRFGYSALMKALSQRSPWASHRQFKGEHTVYYHNAGGYWVKTFTFLPYYRSLRDPNKTHTTISELQMPTSDLAVVYCAVLNSSLFYFFWKSLTDARHVYPSDIAMFPIKLAVPSSLIRELSDLNQSQAEIYRGMAPWDPT